MPVSETVKRNTVLLYTLVYKLKVFSDVEDRNYGGESCEALLARGKSEFPGKDLLPFCFYVTGAIVI